MGMLINYTPQTLLIVFGVILSVHSIPYSKYGRQCSDIGCLSSQVCVMAYDSCSYNQRDGKECGRYPTCKKSTDAAVNGGAAPAPDNSNSDTNFFNPKPTTKRPTSFYDSNNNGGGGGSSGGLDSIFNLPRETTTTRKPYSPPTYPPYNPAHSGGNIYNGGGGGGGFVRPTERPTSRPTYRPTAPPASSGGSGFGGFFSGLQNILSGEIGKLIGNAIKNPSGGAGGFLDTRQLLERRFGGGLFNENPSSSGSGTGHSSANTGRASYPTQPPVYQNPYNSYSGGGSQQYSSNSRGSSLPYPSAPSAPTPPTYGWKMQ
uniref:Putative secreted mucin n=1 Tax=Corethrella appendiculata TaxID=1370023 RepID=U5EPL1_9DIPT